jgi:hypothetical protein
MHRNLESSHVAECSQPRDKSIKCTVTVTPKGNRPVVKLVPIKQGAFKIGLLAGELSGAGPDFFEPLDEKDLALWEGDK